MSMLVHTSKVGVTSEAVSGCPCWFIQVELVSRAWDEDEANTEVA